MTTASVIVINWNGAPFLSQCLEALLREATPDDEIILVDNASTDDSVEQVRSRFPDVTLICNERNLGYAGGANAGLRAARGDVLVLLNPDVQVQRGWLAALRKALEDQAVGVAGCKLYYPDGKTIQHAGGIIRFPQAVADHYGYRQQDDGQWDRQRDVDYVTGASLALRRDVWETVGPLDEGFYPAYYEEVDYCFRARQAGYHVVYVPDATAIHHEYASLGGGSELYLRFFHRSRVRFVLKHKGPAFFLTDLVQAEREWLKSLPPRVRGPLATAYLDQMLDLASLFEHPSPHRERDFASTLEALADLRDQVWRLQRG